MNFVLDSLLVALRVAGVLYTVPILGSRNLPTMIRAALVLFITIFVAPIVAGQTQHNLENAMSFIIFGINELITGIYIGLLITLFLNFIYFAGDLIDTQLGFSMISVINPLDESQMPITSNIFYVLFSMIFLALNFHHRIILSVIESFKYIKIGSIFESGLSLSYLIEVTQQSLVIGIQIAAPFMITVLIADIVMGLLSKAMPGMNIFILGIPFKVLFGLIVFFLLIPFVYDLFASILSDALDLILNYFLGVER